MGVTHLETKWYKMCSQLQMYDNNFTDNPHNDKKVEHALFY